MSYQHANAIREMESEGFDSAIQRYVYLEAAHLADGKGRLYRSMDELSEGTKVSRVTISKVFKELEEKGLMAKEKHGRYRITLPNGVAASTENFPKPMVVPPVIDAQKLIAGDNALAEWMEEHEKEDKEGHTVYPVKSGEELPSVVNDAVANGILRRRQGVAWNKNGESFTIFEVG